MNKLIGFNLSEEQENQLLWLIGSANCDYIFMYEPDVDLAQIVAFEDGVPGETKEFKGFGQMLFNNVYPDDLLLYQMCVDNVNNGVVRTDFEVRLKELHGRRYRWHSVHLRLSEKDGRKFYIGSSTYIDSRKKKESEYTIKARQDDLTGLLNKATIKDNITAYISQYTGEDAALILVEIDNFRNYNDCIGHLFGDEIIKEVGNLLRKEFIADSFVGRVGGDEFLVFIKNLNDINNLVSRLGRFRDELSEVNLGQRNKLNLSVSMGISLFPDHGDEYESLFDKADRAMHHIKNNGKNGYAIYTDELAQANVDDRIEDNIFVSSKEVSGDLSKFAFHLLNESTDPAAALNLLLYKLLNEYGLLAIYVNEHDPDEMKCTVNFECVHEDKYSLEGIDFNYSYEAWRAHIKNLKDKDGAIILTHMDAEKDHCNNLWKYNEVRSVLQVDMSIFSQERGIINFAAPFGPEEWTLKKVNEIKGICNLITMCMYYGSRVVKAEKKLNIAAIKDSLTGLLKEEAFLNAAGRLIADRADKVKLALVYYDISNFKYINETYGYAMGDNILMEMSRYVTSYVKGVRLSGRLYSDNIINVCEFPADTEDSRIVSIVDDINVMMSENLSHRFNIGSVFIRTGVYIVPDSGQDTISAVASANTARKVAKQGGNGRCVLFTREMFEQKKKETLYSQSLDRALLNDEFFICLQPKVAGYENRLVGAEALVRWRLPDGSVLMPGDFVPVFEKNSTIDKLDFYVYEKVMKYIRGRLDEHKKVVPVSMNVSRVHLMSDRFVDRFRELVDSYQIPTQFIELEITESAYLDNIGEISGTITALRNMGIRITMDDFGSGYSSLNALHDLQIDLLKIDRVFMRNNELSKGDRTIVKFIIDMAKNLSMKVLCQGVNSKEQRDFLNEAGCDFHQGFFYSRPVEIVDFDRFLDDEEELFARVAG